jgi:hypothetical protein
MDRKWKQQQSKTVLDSLMRVSRAGTTRLKERRNNCSGKWEKKGHGIFQNTDDYKLKDQIK